MPGRTQGQNQECQIDDSRRCRFESLERLTSRFERCISDLAAGSADDKLVRVLVTVGDAQDETEAVQPRLALILVKWPNHSPPTNRGLRLGSIRRPRRCRRLRSRTANGAGGQKLN